MPSVRIVQFEVKNTIKAEATLKVACLSEEEKILLIALITLIYLAIDTRKQHTQSQI